MTTPFQFAGSYTDAESGLLYLRARYYDPASATFLTRDPLSSLTPYTYAAGAPTNYVDPSGLAPSGVPNVASQGAFMGLGVANDMAFGWAEALNRGDCVGAVVGAALFFAPEFRAGKEAFAASEGSFMSQMAPGEAERYAAYWARGAPHQVEPGIGRMDWTRISGRTARTEQSTAIYDDYGRLSYRVDNSDHMRPSVHSNPHLHQIDYGPGFAPSGFEQVFNFFGGG